MSAVSGTCREYALEIGVPGKDLSTGDLVYQEVVEVTDINAAQLYSRAKATITDLYKSAKDVVQLDDKDAGRIVAKGTYEIVGDALGTSIDYVHHSLTIEAKDGRYRVTVSDLVIETLPSQSNLAIPGFTEPFAEMITDSSCFGRKTRLKNTHLGAVEMLTGVKKGMENIGPTGGDW